MFLDLSFKVTYFCHEIRFTPGSVKFYIKKEFVQTCEDWNGKETAEAKEDVNDDVNLDNYIWKTAKDSIEIPPCIRCIVIPRSQAFVP